MKTGDGMSLAFAHPRFVSMHTVPVRGGGMTRSEGKMGLCLLEELVPTRWHEAWDLPAGRGQGDRERTGVPGRDWGAGGHTKVPVGKGSATSPMANVSNRVCWGFLHILKKYQKICLSPSLSSHVKGQSIGLGRLEIWYFSGTDAKQ